MIFDKRILSLIEIFEKFRSCDCTELFVLRYFCIFHFCAGDYVRRIKQVVGYDFEFILKIIAYACTARKKIAENSSADLIFFHKFAYFFQHPLFVAKITHFSPEYFSV